MVATVRAEGGRLLRRALELAYAPWGETPARRIATDLGDLALALFDRIFIAGQANQSYDPELLNRAVHALRALAVSIRAGL